MRRLLLVPLTFALLILSALPASAHALLESSTPSDGQRVESLDRITFRFSEPPEVSLSSLTLLDTSGSSVALGPLEVDGKQMTATVEGTLDPSTYLASWRVFSQVDGHVTAGAIAFGYRVEASDIDLPEPIVPGITPLGLLGRWLLLLGLALLLGSCFVEFLSPLAVRALPRLAAGGAFAALVGVAVLGHQQRVDSGASIAAFLDTQIGSAILWRAAALMVALAAVFAWGRWMRHRRLPSIAAMTAGVVAGVVHVANGHAAADGSSQVVGQAIHMIAASLWVGGLVPLIAAVRSGNARRVVRRFSNAALVLVVLVIVSGQLRSFDEIGSLFAFQAGTYGRFVVAKQLLLVAILVIAARNRRVHARRVSEDPEPLTRAVRAEAVLAIFAIGAASALANISPGAAAADDAVADRIEVTRTNFAGDVRASLTADPGRPGLNAFEVDLQRLPEEAPIEDADVRLRFRFRGRPGVEPSELQLEEQDPGSYVGEGANLSFAGPFEVTVLVQSDQGSDEVLLPVATITEQQVVELGGEPPITDIAFDDGSSVQVYVDPGSPGNAEVHATFFDAGGGERDDLDAMFVVATGPEGVRPLVTRTLSPGHVVADVFLTEGSWRFDVSGRYGEGEVVSAWFVREIA